MKQYLTDYLVVGGLFCYVNNLFDVFLFSIGCLGFILGLMWLGFWVSEEKE